MRITRVHCHLLHVPLSRPRASPLEAAGGRLNHVVALLVRLETDGPTGEGVTTPLTFTRQRRMSVIGGLRFP